MPVEPHLLVPRSADEVDDSTMVGEGEREGHREVAAAEEDEENREGGGGGGVGEVLLENGEFEEEEEEEKEEGEGGAEVEGAGAYLQDEGPDEDEKEMGQVLERVILCINKKIPSPGLDRSLPRIISLSVVWLFVYECQWKERKKESE